jgi:hypothetical protein
MPDYTGISTRIPTGFYPMELFPHRSVNGKPGDDHSNPARRIGAGLIKTSQFNKLEKQDLEMTYGLMAISP